MFVDLKLMSKCLQKRVYSLCALQIDFNNVRFMQAQRRTITLTNIGKVGLMLTNFAKLHTNYLPFLLQ